MSTFSGHVLSGELSLQEPSFMLKQVKHLETESYLSIENLSALQHYLQRRYDEGDDFVLTLNDQIPVRFSNKEMELLLLDFHEINNHLHF